MFGQVQRPPLKRGLAAIVIINVALYLAELLYAYAVDFHPAEYNKTLWYVAISSDGVFSGYVWQIFTNFWFHDPESLSHILMNMLVLFWFGRDQEAEQGTRRFLFHYIVYGLGGSAFILASHLLLPLFFDISRRHAIGASSAIAGVVALFCYRHWRSVLQIGRIRFRGRTMFLVVIGIDLLRLVLGDNIAVEGHWGGMAAAAIMHYWNDDLHPKVLSLKLKRWRLKRKFKLERGDKVDHGGNGDSRYYH